MTDRSLRAESVSADVAPDFAEYCSNQFAPVVVAKNWLTTAHRYNTREPRSASLSTVSTDGTITARIVAILELDDVGLKFATHSSSNKITDIASGSSANALFYWRELGRQLSLSGEVIECAESVADKVWMSRPPVLDSMSAASIQSKPLANPEVLREKERSLRSDGRLERPNRFRVYALVPNRIEFWAAASDRLHKRIVSQKKQGEWISLRLQP